jgi:hypothetical protein
MTEEVHLTDRQKVQRKWYQANREKQIAYQLQYHNANREERLAYQREYNKKYYQARRSRNVKAEKIEAMIPNDAASFSSKQLKAEKASQRAEKQAQWAEKQAQKEAKAEAAQSLWAIPEGAKPWTFLREEPKRQVHRPQQKKIEFQYIKGQFDLSFD